MGLRSIKPIPLRRFDASGWNAARPIALAADPAWKPVLQKDHAQAKIWRAVAISKKSHFDREPDPGKRIPVSRKDHAQPNMPGRPPAHAT
jgi:hypothetical protein